MRFEGVASRSPSQLKGSITLLCNLKVGGCAQALRVQGDLSSLRWNQSRNAETAKPSWPSGHREQRTSAWRHGLARIGCINYCHGLNKIQNPLSRIQKCLDIFGITGGLISGQQRLQVVACAPDDVTTQITRGMPRFFIQKLLRDAIVIWQGDCWFARTAGYLNQRDINKRVDFIRAG